MTVFVNGTILPVDTTFSERAALAIAGNKVLAVGSRDDVIAAAGREVGDQALALAITTL